MISLSRQYILRLTPQQEQLLAQLAAREDRTRASVLRRLLLAEAARRGLLPRVPRPRRTASRPAPASAAEAQAPTDG